MEVGTEKHKKHNGREQAAILLAWLQSSTPSERHVAEYVLV